MRIVDFNKYEFEGSGSEEITLCSNEIGSTVVSELYVQPLNDIELTITGYVEGDNGEELTAMNIATFELGKVSKKGIYLFATGAYHKVKIDYNGTAEVVVKKLY